MVWRSLALTLAVSSAIASTAKAENTLRSQIVGAYTLTGVYDELADGKKNDTWGPGVKGLAIFDPFGMFSIQTYGDNRQSEPNKGPRDNVVGPAVAYYGTYTVDEATKTLTYHIIQSSFPGWNNFERKVHVDEVTSTTLKTSASNNDPKLGGKFVAHSDYTRAAPIK